MSNLAVITARGGSKRIPRKNIKEFYGKPIIAYSIEAAIESEIFDEVMVSTDDEEIAQIARNYGATVPFMRSAFAASDTATTRDVLLEVLREYKKRGKQFTYMSCLYPTAPFVTIEKLRASYEIISTHEIDLLVPVVKFSYPPQRSFKINSNNFLEYNYPEYTFSRSQDMEQWYHDAGQFYFYNVARFLKKDGHLTDIMPLAVSELEVQDIDNETDWLLAEMKYKMMIEKHDS